MNELCISSSLVNSLWNLFSVINGNPELGNYGVRFTLGLLFSFLLFMIVKMRTTNTMEKKHIVALIGALLFSIRYITFFIFEWGYQIKLYNDPIVHFLFPPIEHFFNMIGFGCIAYYSLHSYNYYPGLIKRILWYIPTSIFAFFVYATIVWKEHFLTILNTQNIILKYNQCDVDWQSHALLAIVSAYLVFVAIIKYSKNCHYLSAFWTITFIEHTTRAICFYYGYEPSWLATIFHGMAIWAIPLLILHFVKAYVVKLRYCEYCQRNTQIP